MAPHARLLPHGSILVNILVRDGRLEVHADFLRLPEKGRVAMLRQVADLTLNRLTLMSDLQQLSLRLDDDRAEEVLLGLLSAYESMAAAAPLVYGEDVASTLWQLGNLHADARRFGEAERMYLRALDKHAEFDGEDPHRYRPATAQCRRSLGRLYEEMHDDARAEEAYLASAAILRELCEDPFERCNHLRSLARTLVLLADLCERRGACGEAARYRTEAEALEAERGA